MPESSTIERAHQDARAGKSSSTQAGEFVREEFHHIREGQHGARSAKQAIAIGLSKARRAGVKLPPPARGKVSEKVRQQARHEFQKGQSSHGIKPVSRRRSQATLNALRHEGQAAASPLAISRQVHAAARRRPASERSLAARQATRTKGHAGLSAAGRKAARTRASH